MKMKNKLDLLVPRVKFVNRTTVSIPLSRAGYHSKWFNSVTDANTVTWIPVPKRYFFFFFNTNFIKHKEITTLHITAHIFLIYFSALTTWALSLRNIEFFLRRVTPRIGHREPIPTWNRFCIGIVQRISFQIQSSLSNLTCASFGFPKRPGACCVAALEL